MKLQINSFFTFLLFFIEIINNPVIAQKGKTWPSYLDYKLKGNIKSWTMKNEDGIIRQQVFNQNGELIKETYKGTVQSYIPPEYLPEKLKIDFEKIYKDKLDDKDSATKFVFNERMQLIEKQTPYSFEINKFAVDGKILFHKSMYLKMQAITHNSRGSLEHTYFFYDTVYLLIVYKYNQAGLLKEFEYYHSDPFQNIRMVYLYDSAFYLIESNRYDQNNINFISDNYLNKFFNSEIDSTFSINNFYSNYWNQGSPSKLTWKYNNVGQKIEYIAYGYQNGPSFKATWEYDDKGQLIKEIHHDVYHNTISCIIEFDMKGNVIKETDFDYWAKKEYSFTYEIVYY